MAEEHTEGLIVKVEASEGYEPPAPVRAALEALAEAVRSEAEAEESEVEGFRMGLKVDPLGDILGKPRPGGPIGAGGGKIGAGPIASEMICLGGFDCSGYEGNDQSCSWVFWD